MAEGRDAEPAGMANTTTSDASNQHMRPNPQAARLEILAHYCAGKITSREAKVCLGVDRRGLIELVGRHGLHLPQVSQARAVEMARMGFQFIARNPEG